VAKLKSYRVTFHEVLRVCVDVRARNPKHAELKAIRQWSDDLWEKADKALEGTASEIIESNGRDFFYVYPNHDHTPSTNESTDR